jgi:integrase
MNNLAKAQFTPTRVKILDGLCRLYTRPDSEYWWATFNYKRRPIRVSTKETDLKKAKLVARDWYMKKQAEVSQGFSPARKTKTFVAAAERALKEMDAEVKRGRYSQHYVDGMRRTLNVIKKTSVADVDIAEVNQQVWTATQKDLLKLNPKMSDRTLHQYRNIINVTLNYALKNGEVAQRPQFARERTGQTDATPRTWFTQDEYRKLQSALMDNIDYHVGLKSKWIEAAEELLDYVSFVAQTGLRIGEARNVRFCDVTIVDDKTEIYLEIRNIKGKRGDNGECKSFYAADISFRRCIKRHALTLENYKESTATIFKGYHRDMFREVLKKADLYRTKDRKPRKRDLMSLRHTYICFRLLDKAPIYDIAANCRTSVQMIQNHYARHLSVLQSTTINANTWEEDEETDEDEA